MTDCLTTNEPNTVVLKHKCTNCMACYNICPSGAIEMKEDKDGFVYPFINEEKCTHCGLCTKKCPALNLEEIKSSTDRTDAPVIYAGYSDNEEIREKSTSGGVFSILAKYILDKGGYVCGARFTRGGICEHVIVDNWEDLAPLRGSKYVQSNINNCYKEIKNLLAQDKYVLFTGTPCQVAALYAVLGKDYEKLFTIDLLCHGLPSQKIFREYLNEITDGLENEVEDFQFRNKIEGWEKPSISYRLRGNYYYYYWDTAYIQGFVKNLILRKSCTDCKYSKLPRNGDFTIGDFWGVNAFDKSINDNKGISVLLLNSLKARNAFAEVKDKFKILKQLTLAQTKVANEWSFSKAPVHPSHSYFMHRYSTGKYSSISTLITECLNKKDGIALLNFGDSKINYGCVLTAYALQQVIKQHGYFPVNIKFYDNENIIDLNNLEDFQKEHLDFTAPCGNINKLKALNENIKTFIVGSDCVWFDFANSSFFNAFKFNFADFSKNICSYAASFLTDKLEKCRAGKIGTYPYTPAEKQEAQKLLRRFSHISVREKSGVDICRENFDINAEHVLDPVFLLRPDEWLALQEKKKYEQPAFHEKNGGAVSYIINWGNLDKRILEYIENINSLKKLYNGVTYGELIRDLKKKKAYGPTVEDWVKNIANCDILYTDSFHGMCFAIIFNKPFILFGASGNGFTRHKSLMDLLGISDRRANNVDDIIRLEKTPIDYVSVNNRLHEEIIKSQKYIAKMLNSHENPDKTRIYIETLEKEMNAKIAGCEQRMNAKISQLQTEIIKLKAIPLKVKWEFLGVQVFKKKLRKTNYWFYIFGIPLIKEVKKEHNTYYKLFGIIRVLKKAVRS